jgi:Pentapeptide repeats (8 copies)
MQRRRLRMWVHVWLGPGRSGPGWWILVLLCLAILAVVIIVAVWKLPSLLYGDVSRASPDARLQAASSFRTAFVAGLAGLAALGSLTIANRTYRLTQQGQITDRYTKAIEQLGSDKQDVRLGGIYALERIANDSPPDRATIEEVLTAFVRGHAPWPPKSPDQPDKDMPVGDLPPLRSWAPDVQAALTVLGRRKPPIGEIARLDLSDTDLRGAHLYQAALRRTDLDRARLQRANLIEVRVEEAFLSDAQLQEADLEGAKLPDALAWGAQLQRAKLLGADLRGAQLGDANLVS